MLNEVGLLACLRLTPAKCADAMQQAYRIGEVCFSMDHRDPANLRSFKPWLDPLTTTFAFSICLKGA